MMKKALLALSVLLCFLSAKSQVYQNNNQYGVDFNRTLARQALGVPLDTFPVPAQYQNYAHLAFKNNVWYFWQPSTLKWVNLATGGTSGLTEIFAAYGLRNVDFQTVEADTAVLFQAFRNTLPPGTDISGKMNYTDTASMLSAYARLAQLAGKVNSVDTANMLFPYARKAYVINKADTAAMLLPYARKTDIPAGGGSGLRRVFALYGLIQTNDSTFRVDSNVVTSRSRTQKIADSLIAIINDKQPIGNYITSLTGDVTASGPGPATATLSPSGVTPGTYTYPTLTVDSKGRLTNVTNGTAPTGTNNANVGTGYRVLKPGTQEVKTVFGEQGVLIDSVNHTNALTFRADTAVLRTVANSDSRAQTDAKLATKVNTADTSAMLGPYARRAEVTAGGVLPGDTSAMLNPYIRDRTYGLLRLGRALGLDSATVYSYARSLVPNVNGKVNYTDTAAMLANYEKTANAIARVATKLNLSDSAAMLNPYIRDRVYGLIRNGRALGLDSATVYGYARSLVPNVNGKVNVSDTAAMLANYEKTANVIARLAAKLNTSDSAAMLNPYIRDRTYGLVRSGRALGLDSATVYTYVRSIVQDVSGKLNVSDTAAMLANYEKTANTLARLGLKVNITDTSGMLAPYEKTANVIARLASKLNTSDSSSMLTPYLRHVGVGLLRTGQTIRLDTATERAYARSLIGPSSGMQYSDTAAMLANYEKTANAIARISLKLNISDSAAMLNPYIRDAVYGLTRNGRALGLDSATVYTYVRSLMPNVAGKLNISDTAAMLANYEKTANVLARLGLKLSISDTSSMLSTYEKTANVLARLTLKLNISDSSAMLTPYLRHVGVGLLRTGQAVRLDTASERAYARSLIGPSSGLSAGDTSAMLNPYIRDRVYGLTRSGRALGLDSATVYSYARSLIPNVSGKLNISDTAAMLNNYEKTANVLARLGLKLNLSDTSALVANYFRLRGYGIGGTGQTVLVDSGTVFPNFRATANTFTNVQTIYTTGTSMNTYLINNASGGNGRQLRLLNLGTGVSGFEMGRNNQTGSFWQIQVDASDNYVVARGGVGNHISITPAGLTTFTTLAGGGNTLVGSNNTGQIGQLPYSTFVQPVDTATMLSPYARKTDIASSVVVSDAPAPSDYSVVTDNGQYAAFAWPVVLRDTVLTYVKASFSHIDPGHWAVHRSVDGMNTWDSLSGYYGINNSGISNLIATPIDDTIFVAWQTEGQGYIKIAYSVTGGRTHVLLDSITNAGFTNVPFGNFIKLPSGRLIFNYYSINGSNYAVRLVECTARNAWTLKSTIASGTTAGATQYNETWIEKIDGTTDGNTRLLGFMRDEDNGAGPMQITSTNGGTTWSLVGRVTGFVSSREIYGSPSSIIKVGDKLVAAKGWRVYQPVFTDKDLHVATLEARISDVFTDPTKWGKPTKLYNARASYNGQINDFGYLNLFNYRGNIRMVGYDVSNKNVNQVVDIYATRIFTMPVFSSSFVSVRSRYTQNVPQNIETPIQFDLIDLDNDGSFNVDTGAVIIKRDGLYSVKGAVTFQGSGEGTYRQAFLRIINTALNSNTSNRLISSDVKQPSSNPLFQRFELNATVFLRAGEKILFTVKHDNIAALPIGTNTAFAENHSTLELKQIK